MVGRFRKGAKRVLQSTKVSLSRVGLSQKRSQEASQEPSRPESSNDVIVRFSPTAPPWPAQDPPGVGRDMPLNTDGAVQVYLFSSDHVFNNTAEDPEPRSSLLSWSLSQSDNAPLPLAPESPQDQLSWSSNRDSDPYLQERRSVSSGVSYTDPSFPSSNPAYRDVAVQTERYIGWRASNLISRSFSRRRSNIVWNDRREAIPNVRWQSPGFLSGRTDSLADDGDVSEEASEPPVPVPVRPSRDGVPSLKDFLDESYPGLRNDLTGPLQIRASPTTEGLRRNFEVASVVSPESAEEKTTSEHHARPARPRGTSVQKLGRIPAGFLRPGQTDMINKRRGWRVLQLNYMSIPPSPAQETWLTGGILGHGSYGVVYFAYHVPTQEEFAMKVVNYASGLSHGACRGIVNELKTLQCFASCGDQMSPFVMGPALRVERWAWRSPGGFIHMLSDVAGGGTLMDYRGKLWPETLQLIAAELVLGIQFLHSVGIIHHDLKPDNVLVTSSGHCLITDFGAVKFTNSGRLTRNEHEDVIFTPEFAAPEMLEDADGQEYDGTVDYFSLGAIMGAMVVVLGDHDVLLNRKNSNPEADVLRVLGLLVKQRSPSELINFVRDLLMVDPASRPDDKTVRHHDYFSKLNWADIVQGKYPPFPYVKTPMLMAHGSSVIHMPASGTMVRQNLPNLLEAEGLALELNDSFNVRMQHEALVCDL